MSSIFTSANLTPLFCVFIQVPFYIPLAWVRKIRKFALTNLVADAFIVLGLMAILIYSLHVVLGQHPTVRLRACA